MTAQLPTLPASLSRADGLPPGDIDARILQVEQRLIAREENLRRGATAFSAHAQQALETIKKQKTVRIGVPADMPPLGFKAADGQLRGLEVDMAHLIAA